MRSDRGTVTLWLGLIVAFAAFGLGTPRYAGPDEPAHQIRAAGLVRGDLFGAPNAAGPAFRTFSVPGWVGQPDPSCYAFDPLQRAGCSSVEPGDHGDTLVTTAASYPPFAHVLPGIATLIVRDARALWLSRLLSAALCGYVVAQALIHMRRSGHTLALAALLTSVTPVAVFNMSVVNPSGPTSAGAMAVSVAVATSTGWRRYSTASFLIGAACLAWSRSDGWFSLAAVVALTLLATRQSPVAWWRSLDRGGRIGLSAIGVSSLAWSLAVRPRLVHVPTELGGAQLLRAVVLRTVDHLREGVGRFGWLDTELPPLGYFLWAMLVGGLVIAVWFAGDQRAIGAAGLSVLAFVAMGWAVDLASARSVGLVWQGRYSLPILIAGVAALGGRGDRPGGHLLPDGLAAAIGGGALAVWAAACYQGFRRWSVGADGALLPTSWEKGASAVHPAICLAVLLLALIQVWSCLFRGNCNGPAAGSTAVAPEVATL